MMQIFWRRCCCVLGSMLVLKDIEKAYDIFENKLNGVIKIAITNDWIFAIRKGGFFVRDIV